MSKFLMLIGPAGSGKSTIAEQLREKEGFIIYSSDKIREELFGDESVQANHKLVFDTLHSRIIKSLEKGESCIYDATNIRRDLREKFLHKISHISCEKTALVLTTPAERCLEQNRNRARYVPEDVILCMCKNIEYPTLEEGWTNIIFN
jgi:predicted kinase